MSEKAKRVIDPSKLPCAMMQYNEIKRKDELRKPSVHCTFACDRCGWNPKEAKRRMETGEFVKRRNGVRTLIFRRYYDVVLNTDTGS